MEIDFKKVMLSPFILKRDKVREIMKAEKKIEKQKRKQKIKKDPLTSWGVTRFLNYRNRKEARNE